MANTSTKEGGGDTLQRQAARLPIDIIHGTGLETRSINTFSPASPCYGGRGHVRCALFGIMAGVDTAAPCELLRTAIQGSKG